MVRFLVLCLLLVACVPASGTSRDFSEDISQAKSLYDAGDYDEAQRAFAKIEAEAKAANNRSAEAQSLFYSGLILRNEGEFQEALGALGKSAILYRSQEDKLGEARAFNSVGITYDYLKSPVEARGFYEQAKLLFTEVGDALGQANAMMNIAILDTNEGDLGRAYLGLTEANSLFAELADAYQSRLGQARTLNNLATLELERGQLDGANVYLLEAAALFKLLELPKELGDSYLALGRLELQRSNFRQAELLFEDSLEIYQSIGHVYQDTARYYLEIARQK